MVTNKDSHKKKKSGQTWDNVPSLTGFFFFMASLRLLAVYKYWEPCSQIADISFPVSRLTSERFRQINSNLTNRVPSNISYPN